MRADNLLARVGLNGAATWKWIIQAIKELERMEPDTLHQAHILIAMPLKV